MTFHPYTLIYGSGLFIAFMWFFAQAEVDRKLRKKLGLPDKSLENFAWILFLSWLSWFAVIVILWINYFKPLFNSLTNKRKKDNVKF